MFKIILSILALFLLTGCASIPVTLTSSPPGAKIIDVESGDTLGETPLEGSVSVSKLEREKDGCTEMGEVKAVWKSGAVATLKKENTVICKDQKEAFFLIERPEFADIEKDIKYALDKKRKQDNINNFFSIIGAIGTVASAFAEGYNTHNNTTVPSISIPNRSFDTYNSNKSKSYKSPISNNSYQYDLSNPSDRAIYSTDTGAQMRDSINSTKTYIDRQNGFNGGGIIE